MNDLNQFSPSSQPPVHTPAAAQGADSATGSAGQSAFPQSWYRPRFIVLPTGRTIFAWGVFDTQNKPIPSRLFKMSEFVKRFRHANLGKAHVFARKLNAECERKVAA